MWTKPKLTFERGFCCRVLCTCRILGKVGMRPCVLLPVQPRRPVYNISRALTNAQYILSSFCDQQVHSHALLFFLDVST